MSLVTDSPVNSSSSDDFAALLDAELDSGSSDSSPGEEVEDDNNVESSPEDDNNVESERCCLICFIFYMFLYVIYIYLKHTCMLMYVQNTHTYNEQPLNIILSLLMNRSL